MLTSHGYKMDSLVVNLRSHNTHYNHSSGIEETERSATYFPTRAGD